MPWSCCGVEVHDNQVCMTCGARKRSHSMRLDRTRVFSLGAPPWPGDGEAQAEALERAHEESAALVEECPATPPLEAQLVGKDERPVAGARVLVTLPDGREVEAWTDDEGVVRVLGVTAEEAGRVRVRFLDHPAQRLRVTDVPPRRS